MGVNERTVRNTIKTLTDRRWCNIDPKTGILYIKGIDRIRHIEEATRKRSAWFDTIRIKESKAFVISAATTSLILPQRKREYLALARKNGMAYDGVKLLPSFYPIACGALSKCFNLAKSTAMEYKTLADRSQFLQVKKTPPRQFLINGKPIDPDHLYSIKKTYPKMGHRIFKKRDGKIYIQDTDLVKSLLIPNRRRRTIKI